MRMFLLIGFLMMSWLSPAQTMDINEIRKSIYFGGGSYYIDDDQITELYHWLDSIPGLHEKYSIQLISHTDPIGGKEYNEWLSGMRSSAVHQLLTQHAIPEHKITIKDWGFENPVYSNESWSGMQLNRRVDVILHPVVF
jgi:outer membrane protein OmpA-like peptidoglycan-associated protein